MRIAQISSPFQATPPETYGGKQRIVAWLTEALVRHGHDVTLYATGDSRTSARLRYVFDSPAPNRLPLYALMHVARAFADADEYDIIHNHVIPGISFADFCSTPCITSLNDSLSDPQLVRFLRSNQHHNFVAVSQRQVQLLPDLNWTGIVQNGFDAGDWPFSTKKENYVVWMGRLRPEKGAHLAIQAALEAGVQLILIGPKEPWQHEYFERQIAPHLNGQSIIYLGELGDERKAVVKNARALLFPITWEEAFGLVMVEAMACGTPVIAFDIAAIPEIVKHGETGLIVSGVDEMAKAILCIDDIDPLVCRNHVQTSFSVEKMVDGYLEVYGRFGEVGKS